MAWHRWICYLNPFNFYYKKEAAFTVNSSRAADHSGSGAGLASMAPWQSGVFYHFIRVLMKNYNDKRRVQSKQSESST